MWKCPKCGRKFANRNQEHMCERAKLAPHFRGKDRTLFDAYVAEIRKIGPVTIVPNRTRIGLQVRMIFSAVMIRKDYLRGHLVLRRRIDHPRFLQVVTYSPGNHMHVFRLDRIEDIDRHFRGWLREAYQCGLQTANSGRGPALRTRSSPSSSRNRSAGTRS